MKSVQNSVKSFYEYFCHGEYLNGWKNSMKIKVKLKIIKRTMRQICYYCLYHFWICHNDRISNKHIIMSSILHSQIIKSLGITVFLIIIKLFPCLPVVCSFAHGYCCNYDNCRRKLKFNNYNHLTVFITQTENNIVIGINYHCCNIQLIPVNIFWV